MSIEHMKENKVFLATTALEDFWDTSMQIIFLTDACMRYNRKVFWEKLKYTVLHSPFESKDSYYQSFNELKSIYESFLRAICNTLNEIHGVSHDERYWRITLGPWLFHFIHVLYERYASIKNALKEYPEFITYGLSEESFEVPQDTAMYFNFIEYDKYNLQLYTMILNFLGVDFPRKPLKEYVSHQTHFVCKNWRKDICRHIGRLLSPKIKVWVRSAYFASHVVKLSIFLSFHAKLWFDFQSEPKVPIYNKIDSIKRKAIKISINYKNELDHLLVTLLPLCIPKIYVEGFKRAQNQINRYYLCSPKVIISGVGWYCDEIFKFWSAVKSEQGVKIIGVQHGANYGVDKYNFCEYHEQAISDYFFSWGWTVVSNRNIKPMPAPKFIGRKIIGADNKKQDILLSTISCPRYFYRFHNLLNFDNQAYLIWQQRFMSGLSLEKRYKVRVRLFAIDYGNDCKQRWKDFDPNIRIEDWSTGFEKSLKTCRIHISDHLSSTFADGLILGKPTILFWDPQIFQIRPKAEPYFDELRRVGILYDLPETAAAAAESIYEDVETWWKEPCRQLAVENYCNKYVLTSHDACKKWVKEIKALSEKQV
jgi:putative transferase (TIGR04331 family)